MKEIIVKIDADGNLSTEANGFKGRSCLTETMKLLDKLSAKPISQRFKPEYNQQVGQSERIKEC